jgi:hypothetical protein
MQPFILLLLLFKSAVVKYQKWRIIGGMEERYLLEKERRDALRKRYLTVVGRIFLLLVF